ncbi:NADH dehydrogenase subunit J [Nodularia spumigena CCY9414]|jgi:NAD(P)H-quinone oxidoreductase subunit 6|nr:NADH dehydrogenase subunit J [Nodularia spumigena CCY9414]
MSDYQLRFIGNQKGSEKVNLAEGVQFVALGILGVMMIGAALGVVLFSNVVYSAFMLGGVFISMAAIYLLLNGDFVAAAQVLVYVGAVNVLILFAIMLVNKREDFAPFPSTGLRKVLTAVVSLGLFGLLSVMVLGTPWAYSTPAAVAPESSIVVIGEHFFTDFLLPFELASVLLLIAMVGAIILARREYLPEQPTSSELQQSVLTLPERPRDLVSAGSETKE